MMSEYDNDVSESVASGSGASGHSTEATVTNQLPPPQLAHLQTTTEAALHPPIYPGSPAAQSAPTNAIQLDIVQQPERTRVCGFSVSDRRPISPPPIIKVLGRSFQDTTSLVAFATLWSTDLEQCMSFTSKAGPPLSYKSINGIPGSYDVSTTEGYQKSFLLMGSLISECHLLRDDSNQYGLFFVFPDLAVRTTGSFRLKIDVFDMRGMNEGTKAAPLATTMTNVFEVYRPADFPGLPPPTPLSCTFSRQGIPVKMKYATY
ncbi:hypothetical protein BCR33DRAFT_845024 [Rhizoclosmatium globosum]|uniref:Velvet domain-containing protein n=1 Tax=Rhizoclosmatium globosum TaxID=329046 RepID=A0A1Y2D3R5_9FUNG|nr:hypothetical protein BCR33DRAFT_845024 [Rhizoclosmatium globosum]|eukprot:ORY53784.1 hypothetical protein BCR33DRAFT_845024 [Rhizoclosmatium globosum]